MTNKTTYVIRLCLVAVVEDGFTEAVTERTEQSRDLYVHEDESITNEVYEGLLQKGNPAGWESLL